jgi:hypothetical protein
VVSSSYCSECDTPWPFAEAYRICPQCDHRTTASAREALRPDDALWLANHVRAERVYVEHELQRQREGKLSPDAEGRLEARKIIENTRQLEAQLSHA